MCPPAADPYQVADLAKIYGVSPQEAQRLLAQSGPIAMVLTCSSAMTAAWHPIELLSASSTATFHLRRVMDMPAPPVRHAAIFRMAMPDQI
ncbi:hypothetical protein DEU52_14618 [Ensifer adhaerens]|nr:hypothetical protein DEU52_14618 [Ensifer adhaerens]